MPHIAEAVLFGYAVLGQRCLKIAGHAKASG